MPLDERPQEDIDLEKERAHKPPRFMIVIKDFQTDFQIQVGAPTTGEFFKPLPRKAQKPGVETELDRVVAFFDRKVRQLERTPQQLKKSVSQIRRAKLMREMKEKKDAEDTPPA